MFRFLKRHRPQIAAAVLFLLPLVIYRAHAIEPVKANVFDRLILAATAPIERLLAFATDAVALRWYLYVDVTGARRENIDLRREQVALARKAADAEALSAENERLRVLLDLRARRPEFRTIAATVIAGGSSPLVRAVRIDRGLVDGIREGMAVVAGEGVVGRVQRASFNSAEVWLIADEKVSLEVVVARSRARGRSSGSGFEASKDRLRISRLQQTDDVRAGDRITTSGLGGVYPSGIPVGTVTRVDHTPGDAERVVEVEPAVDFARLEQVLVVLDDGVLDEPLVTPGNVLPPELRTAAADSTVSATTAAARSP